MEKEEEEEEEEEKEKDDVEAREIDGVDKGVKARRLPYSVQ